MPSFCHTRNLRVKTIVPIIVIIRMTIVMAMSPIALSIVDMGIEYAHENRGDRSSSA